MGHGFRETGSVDGRTPLRRLESTMVPTGEAVFRRFCPRSGGALRAASVRPERFVPRWSSDGRALRSDAIPGSYLPRLGLGAF